MKLTPNRFAILIVTLAAMLSMLTGCPSQTPARTLYVSVETANAGRDAINDAYAAHLLTKPQFTALVPYMDAVGKAELDLNEGLQRHDPNTASLWQALTDAFVALQNAKVKTAATQPH